MNKTYLIWFACPHCKRPCSDPNVPGNDYVPAKNKTEARALFNSFKHCRHCQIIKIEEVTR